MIRKLSCIDSAAVAILAAFFFIYSPIRAVLDIRDTALGEPESKCGCGRSQRRYVPFFTTVGRCTDVF